MAQLVIPQSPPIITFWIILLLSVASEVTQMVQDVPKIMFLVSLSLFRAMAGQVEISSEAFLNWQKEKRYNSLFTHRVCEQRPFNKSKPPKRSWLFEEVQAPSHHPCPLRIGESYPGSTLRCSTDGNDAVKVTGWEALTNWQTWDLKLEIHEHHPLVVIRSQERNIGNTRAFAKPCRESKPPAEAHVGTLPQKMAPA